MDRETKIRRDEITQLIDVPGFDARRQHYSRLIDSNIGHQIEFEEPSNQMNVFAVVYFKPFSTRMRTLQTIKSRCPICAFPTGTLERSGAGYSMLEVKNAIEDTAQWLGRHRDLPAIAAFLEAGGNWPLFRLARIEVYRALGLQNVGRAKLDELRLFLSNPSPVEEKYIAQFWPSLLDDLEAATATRH